MIWGTLFSGGGGVDCGLKMAGHQIAWGIEMVPQIAACYRANHHEPLIEADLRMVDLSTLPAIDALWASPVCKQDSKARNKTLAPREDASIGIAIIKYIEHFQPELVVLENVDGYKKNPTLTTLIAYLSRHYSISERVLNAANYGIPQNRKRLIVQARRGPIAWPEYAPVRVGWYEALQDLFATMPEDTLAGWQQQLWKAEYDALLPVMVAGHYDFRDKGSDPKSLCITPASEVSPTITSSHNNTQRRIMLADGRILRLTPRETARLQSFPDDYLWPAKVTLAQEIIGNAVPPLLVKQLTTPYTSQRRRVA
jgi:DNA (cytosine-5)-methyltransferase 1